jgi:hypothetical protein
MIGMNDVHGVLENRSFIQRMFSEKIELEKLTNSKPGTKLSVFMKTTIPFLWFAMTIGEMSSH